MHVKIIYICAQPTQVALEREKKLILRSALFYFLFAITVHIFTSEMLSPLR